MGHGDIKDKDLRGENISTVGVDIGDLVLQKGSKKLVFRTWDFGGQVCHVRHTSFQLAYCYYLLLHADQVGSPILSHSHIIL